MSRMFERIAEHVAKAAEEALHDELPQGIEDFEDKMNELDELRDEAEKFEERLEAIGEDMEQQREEFKEMLRDLIRANINHAILSPYPLVRSLALEVAKKIVDEKNKESVNEVIKEVV